MKFITHNEDKDIKVCGTHLVGEIDADYMELVELFGEPTNGDGYKVDAEWTVKFKDGTIATIYNYKTGKNYNGAEGEETEKIRDWHIGGHDKNAYERVMEVIVKNQKHGKNSKKKMNRSKMAEKIRNDDNMQNQLDDIISDLHSIVASNINNEGAEAQLRWLEENGQNVEDIFKSISEKEDA